MIENSKKVVIIGGGIAGLCTAVYALRCGYRAELLEMHDVPGGLATSWRRSGYTFETCLHWLLGSDPNGQMYSQWAEVFDIANLAFINHDEFVRLETEHGDCLRVFSNIDRLESEMMKLAPEESRAICEFTSTVRSLTRFKLPNPSLGLAGNWATYIHDVPCLPLLRRLSHITVSDYGRRFTNPLLRRFFGEGETAQLSAIALFFSLAWMSQRNAGYPIGGSQAVIQLIAQKLAALGGTLRLGTCVDKILVENDTAVGVRLTTGEKIRADWVISAADGHATIFDLLCSRYIDKDTDRAYREMETFPSYVQVSLGVARDLSTYPGFVTRLLDSPIHVDPGTPLNQVSFRIFHFDPTFAPPGKTAVTCFLPTSDFEYWLNLYHREPPAYQAEKRRVADAAIETFERMIPGIRTSIEVIDVSTPATVIRYTGNWKGSMEGWLLTPETGFRPLRNTLPGLRGFMKTGQWVMPGGGLPSGLLTARTAIRAMCRHDHVRFTPGEKAPQGVSPIPNARPTSASTATH
jgi:phytoene dehydrogenase-like protein